MCRPTELSSTSLKSSFVEEFRKLTALTISKKKIDTLYLRGYQAHHIVPVQIIKKFSSSDDYDFYNCAWNCLMVPNSNAYIVHNGSHPSYNDFVQELISGYLELYNSYGDEISPQFGSSLHDVAVAAADLIKTEYNRAETEQRIAEEVITMDEFADKYLWKVYG